MTPDQDQSELLLRAFRYISGELSAEEATAFESELSGDQSARDALADVVELSEAIAVEEFDRREPLRREAAAVHNSPKRASRLGLVVSLSVIAVACGLVLNNGVLDGILNGILISGRQPEFGRGLDFASQTNEHVTVPKEGDADSVLSLWSELGVGNTEQFRVDAVFADESDVLPTTENDIPDWLLTAVVGDVDETGSDMPDGMRELMDDLDHENL